MFAPAAGSHLNNKTTLLTARTLPFVVASCPSPKFANMNEPTTDVAAVIPELPATKEKLDELTQAASLQYSLKNFSAAADHYADAAEIQSKLNGEMAPENAELLFNYGRALYKVAIAKSDVLGTKVAQEEKKKPKTKKVKKEETILEEDTTAANGASAAAGKEQTVESKPFFQLTGMENWDGSDEEDEEDGEGEDGQEEEQDDFGDAFEMFEIARVLYHKQLEPRGAGDSADKGKAKAELSPEDRAIKEKLADIYGFLVDLSFENERFHDAIPDARTSLELLGELYPFGHEKVTSAHYTLSLALEFASMAKIREQQANQEADSEDAQKQEEDVVDWDLRNEATKQTELAIQNQKAHLQKAEESLSSETFTPERKKELEAELADKKSMLEDLKTRVSPPPLPFTPTSPC
jgi:HAT1-interacting factor 1